MTRHGDRHADRQTERKEAFLPTSSWLPAGSTGLPPATISGIVCYFIFWCYSLAVGALLVVGRVVAMMVLP